MAGTLGFEQHRGNHSEGGSSDPRVAALVVQCDVAPCPDADSVMPFLASSVLPGLPLARAGPILLFAGILQAAAMPEHVGLVRNVIVLMGDVTFRIVGDFMPQR